MLKRILSMFAAFVLLLGCFFFNGLKTAPTVSYAATKNGLDVSSVESDLGEDFNWLQYPWNPLGKADVAQFVEYCYTDDLSRNGNYSLYLYVYNPTAVAYAPTGNVVNMAVTYDEQGEPTSYSNLGLSLCGYSTGIYNRLIYKFRINVSSKIYTNARNSQQDHGFRRYDIAGVQLRAVGETLAEDNKVARSYRCTGFAKGYDETSQESSTYSCKWGDSLALELDLHSTFFRPEGTNGTNSFTQDTLHTVYFSVPNSVVEKFDELHRVRFSYVKALTDLMFITGDYNVYSNILKYIGVSGFRFQNNNLGLEYGFAGRELPSYEWVYRYNAKDEDGTAIDRLDYIFWAGEGTDSADQYVLKPEDILSWMSSYSDTYGAGEKAFLVDGVPYRNYSSELFSYGSTKTREVDIYSTDEFPLLSDKIELTWWDRLWLDKKEQNQYDSISDKPFYGIEGIKRVTDDDISLSVQEVCQRLYIDSSDYAEFIAFYVAESLKGNTVYLLRFDVSPYVCMEAVQGKRDSGSPFISGFGDANSNARLSQQFVYFDCDVIFLEYEKDGEYTVIPVVASPIDVIADATPPVYTTSDDGCDGPISALLMLALLVLLVVVFGPTLLKKILKGLWKIICWPFKKVGQALRRRR